MIYKVANYMTRVGVQYVFTPGSSIVKGVQGGNTTTWSTAD